MATVYLQNACCQAMEKWVTELQRMHYEAERTLEQFEKKLQDISTEFRYVKIGESAPLLCTNMMCTNLV